MRRALVLAVSLLVVGTAVPSHAATPRLQRELMVFSYDGRGPALLDVEGSVEAKGRPGYFATVIADSSNGVLDPFFPDLVELGDDGAPVRTYGSVGAHDVCASPVVTCSPIAGSGGLSFGTSFSVGKSSTPVHLRMVVAMEGTHVDATHLEIGWKAHVRRGGFARVMTGGTGARVLGSSVEALPDASLRGGRHGSIAIGIAPCDVAGAGVVTLAGGAAASTATCPTSAFAAAAGKATTWSLSGPAAGLTSYRTRLIDLDL